MKKIIIGKKENDIKYDFRETCFGIVIKNNKLYCTEKNKEISLIGGGIEQGETYEQCLKREFMEEAGCNITKIEELCTIDCFWITREKKNMESLANIYIVEISENIVEPSENCNKLKIIDLKDVHKVLKLPYQKKAIEEYYLKQKKV